MAQEFNLDHFSGNRQQDRFLMVNLDQKRGVLHKGRSYDTTRALLRGYTRNGEVLSEEISQVPLFQ